MTDPMMTVVLVAKEELLAMENLTPRTSNDGGEVKRGHCKGLLTIEVEAMKNTDKTRP